MRKGSIAIIIVAAVLFASCQKDYQLDGVYYAPTNYIIGLETVTMLTTGDATVDINTNGGTADIIFFFRAPDNGHFFNISSFVFNIPGVSVRKDGDDYSLNGKDVIGDITYTMINDYSENRKTEYITRSFNVSGSVNKKNPSKSSISFTAKFLDKTITLSARNITIDASKAEFGQPGYPCVTDEWRPNTKRLFVNKSGHVVTVGYSADDTFTYEQTVTIKDGESGLFYLNEEFDVVSKSRFILTFDDSRVSTHLNKDGRYEYIGLPLEVKDTPLLRFHCGFILYQDNHAITYTIVPEIYTNASVQE